MSDPVTTWLPVPIRTGRVVVRPPDRGDEDAIVELFTDPEVRRFLGGPVEPEVAHARAAEIVSGATRGQFVIVELATGVVVGSGDISRKRGPWEISYQLRPASWGRGLASEAISALVDWFFANTDEDLLIAVTQDANARSARLLERNGATLATRFEQYGALQRQYEFRRAGQVGPEGHRVRV
ncbi:GNAT family N-acetyltransferase [Micromonospora sp. NBC_01796]|uniref:GNAT family N-acetyltransferase n=1 Tax=Micromonospora sp. NBC_01796 TaxID=2975987 RepID=UPI002DD9A970|nr:GNAT family N-acetyltransferase [Micromonospora sp. NBC_01796]WSA87579.1 GNAT family N-acetyltransferase [Micromonospora sp. NBC_01796]